MYPASMTKVMTAIVAIEALPEDLQKQITLSGDGIPHQPYKHDATQAGFQLGEKVNSSGICCMVLCCHPEQSAVWHWHRIFPAPKQNLWKK